MEQKHQNSESGSRLAKKTLPFAIAFALAAGPAFFPGVYADINSDFTASPLKSHSLAWYWLNASINNDTIDRQLTCLRDSSLYTGVVPCFCADNYLDNAAFLPKYAHMITKCGELGMSVCFNDDYGFPSGSAHNAMEKYPQYCGRVLSKTEQDVTGPTTASITVPGGTLMGCVAMSNTDHSVINDITANVSGGKLTWTVPAGSWKIMIFVNNKYNSYVNYLDSAGVKTWIGLTYQAVYNLIPSSYWGTTITSGFFDDVQYMELNRWVDNFNTKFMAKYGYSPVKYYPAMFYDIGVNTGVARNLIFGFRDDLLSRSWGKQIAEWCTAHKIESTGHYGGTGNIAWFNGAGDPIRFFKHTQQVGTEGWVTTPGWWWENMRTGYRLCAAAMWLYDKRLFVNQHYAAMGGFDKNMLYGLASESFICGVNYQYPDGVFYNFKDIIFPPELSWRDPKNGPLMPEYNKWCGRIQMILQGSRHVADIALLFPIAGYYASDYVEIDPYLRNGDYDYQSVGDSLYSRSRRDFTYMHPEVLDSNCTIDAVNHTINLNNKINWERYKVFIIPGRCPSGVINVSTIRKAREFYDKGGIVIFTSKLPSKSAELGMDTAVVNCAAGIFGTPGNVYKKVTNAAGGKAYFVPNFNESVSGADRLTWVLNDALPVWDVKFGTQGPVSGGQLGYIHKVLDGVDYYFFGNNSSSTVNTPVRLRGKFTAPKTMDPHTGVIANATFSNAVDNGQDVTIVNLSVGPFKAMFISGVSQVSTGPDVNQAGVDKSYSFLVRNRGAVLQIGFTLPQSASNAPFLVQLFDLNGRVVSTLTGGKPVAAGYHTVSFDGRGLSVGHYLCRVKAKGFEKSAIVSLVR